MLIVVIAWVDGRRPAAPARPPRFEVASAVGVRQQLVADLPSPVPTSRGSGRRRRWTICGRSRSRSSSTSIWPFLLLLGVRFIPERAAPRSTSGRAWRSSPSCVALASAIVMALLYQPAFDPSRIYDGTDTRAFGLLFGAALAMVWPSRALTRRVTPQRAVAILDVARRRRPGHDRPAGLAHDRVLARSSTAAGSCSSRWRRCCVVAACAHPATRLGPSSGCSPLRWIGVRSYGIYLWHQPIIVLTTPALAHGHDPVRVTASGGRDVRRGRAVVALRRGARPPRRSRTGVEEVRSEGWRPRALSRETRVALVAAAVALVLASVALAGVKPPGVSSSASGQMLGAVGSIQSRAGSSATARAIQTAARPRRIAAHVVPRRSCTSATRRRRA